MKLVEPVRLSESILERVPSGEVFPYKSKLVAASRNLFQSLFEPLAFEDFPKVYQRISLLAINSCGVIPRGTSRRIVTSFLLSRMFFSLN